MDETDRHDAPYPKTTYGVYHPLPSNGMQLYYLVSLLHKIHVTIVIELYKNKLAWICIN